MRLFLLIMVTIAVICSGCRTATQREFSAIAAQEQVIHESSTLTEGQKMSALEKTATERRELNSRLRDAWDRRNSQN